MFIDAYHLISQRDFDSGDTLQREAMVAFGKKIQYNSLTNTVAILNELSDRPTPEQIMDELEVAPGIYIRHPDPTKWYSNPDTTSRDQIIPVFAYCAAYEDYARLNRLFWATLKRGMFAQNTLRAGAGETDRKIPDPMHMTLALFIRAGGWWTAPLYPLLFLTDSIELLATLVAALPLHWQDDHILPRMRDPNDVDDNNSIIQHLMAVYYKPTPISWLNRYFYSVTRPINNGNLLLNESNPVMGALRWYHRDTFEGDGNPEIAELYRPLVDEYFTFRSPLKMAKESLMPAQNFFVSKWNNLKTILSP